MPGLRGIRRLYAGCFFGLFGFLLAIGEVDLLQGYDPGLLLELDPLTALATGMTSGTLYRGLALALLVVIPTLFFGRFFCSWICPLGILNQWVGYWFHGRRPAEEIHLNRYRSIFRIKYYLLAALLAMALAGVLQIGLLDPVALITRSFVVGVWPSLDPRHPLYWGGGLIAGILLAIVVLNRLLPRFWCRVLCPLGALLGVLSWRALWRIRRDVTRCTDCMKCLRGCQGGCDPFGHLRVSECHLCMNCLEACPESALHYGWGEERSAIHRPLDINRRRLVESGLAALLLVPMIRSSYSAARASLPAVIRPPGSLPEPDFLARCIKCAVCMRVCPTHVLQPALLEGGVEGLWTPILINRLGYCEHSCVLCGQVCPTGAIKRVSVAEKIGGKPFTQPLKLGTAFFDQGRCLPWAMQTPCIVCEEVCPTSPKAIWYQTVSLVNRQQRTVRLKQPFVDPSLCTGCGICENKCPVVDLAAIRVTSVGESRSPGNQMILATTKTFAGDE